MQTSVDSPALLGEPGQLADLHTSEFGDVGSVTSSETAAAIPFGVVVKAGTTDDSAKLVAANTDALIGITVFSHLFDDPTQITSAGLLPTVTFGILRRGRIIVVSEDAITPASEVHVRATANGGNTQPGKLRGTADGAHTIDITPFAKWRSSCGAGGLAVLEVDFTGSSLAAADS